MFLDTRAQIEPILTDYCERCSYKKDIVITLDNENLPIEMPMFSFRTWDNENENYGITSDNHTKPNGTFTASGLSRLIPQLKITGIKVADIEQGGDAMSDLMEDMLEASNSAVGMTSYVSLITDADELEEISNDISKGTRTIMNFYNQMLTMLNQANSILGIFAGNNQKKTTETTINLLNAWASKNNGKYMLYFHGIKYKNLALHFDKSTNVFGYAVFDLTFTYVPRIDIEPTMSGVKLPFIKGLTGAKENLVSQAEESTTLLKSIASNISLF